MKILILVCILGLLVFGGTAIAQDDEEVLSTREMLLLQRLENIETTTTTTSTSNLPVAAYGLAGLTAGAIFFMFLTWLALWIIPSVVCSVAAERKGLSRNAFFFFSLVFSPMLGFLAVIAFPAKSKF